MNSKIIGIAGGSGSGKSTLSYALVDPEPDTFEVINLDDYQRLRSDPDLPKLAGMINWDHPDVIRWSDLIADLSQLKRNGLATITIHSWAHRSNPEYFKHYKLKPRVVTAKPIILVEGYLALHNKELNKLYDRSYYLDLDQETRHWRRNKDAVLAKDAYLTKVLEPMHAMYVEPSKLCADKIIDVSKLSTPEVYKIVYDDLAELDS